LEGIINLLGFKTPLQNMKNYTDESVKRWLRPFGFTNIIMGGGLACFNAYVFDGHKITALLVIGLIAIVIPVILHFIFIKKYLVKK
ncbi:MAG: hypothetical protein RR436_00460, partial [Clostridia bacterium]